MRRRTRRVHGGLGTSVGEGENDTLTISRALPQATLPAPLILQDTVGDTILRLMCVHMRRVFPALEAFTVEDLVEAMLDVREQIEHVTQAYVDDDDGDEEEGE